MKTNETLRFKVEPKMGYGAVDPKKFITIARYYNMSLFETVPMSYFTDRNITIENGTSFDTNYGVVFVQNISGDNVTIYYYTLSMSPGQVVDIAGLPTTVVNISNFTALMERNLTLNKAYVIQNPDTNMRVQYRVANETDTTITLDANYPLAGKELEFEVTLLKVEKAQGPTGG
jgi:FKBP-type peptidyl-prolyl cis-trans isomerase 2